MAALVEVVDDDLDLTDAVLGITAPASRREPVKGAIGD